MPFRLALCIIASSFLSPIFAVAAENTIPPPDQPWYRDVGEYIASRSVRIGNVTDTGTRIITDGKRFDVTLGKRIPLYSWGQVNSSEGWTVGLDGVMLASLARYSRASRFTFATNTFDGAFGAFVGYTANGWLALFRSAHLSAHLVDNSPQILSPVSYSQFWNEIIVGKTFPDPQVASDWDFHVQGSLGLNNTSAPGNRQPRASLGVDGGYSLQGPNSLGLVASADLLRAGVFGQRNTYSLFFGLGTLNRPQTTHRPFRAGVAHFWGSDYRNQYYSYRQKWTTFEVAAEF